MAWGVAFPALGRRRADRFPARERFAAAGGTGWCGWRRGHGQRRAGVDDGAELGLSATSVQGYTYLGYR